VVGADGLAFGEFDVVFAGVAEDGGETAGMGEQAIDGPCGGDVAFADLAGPMEDGDAVVLSWKMGIW